MRKAAAFLPKDVEAQANLGVILHDRGRPAEAEAAYRKALAIKPDYPEARKNLRRNSICAARAKRGR